MDYRRADIILRSEMVCATGCTEPGAIAYVASVAREYLREPVVFLEVVASGNVVKNAMSAGIPGTPYTGMNYAAAIGAVGGKAEKKLSAIAEISPEEYAKAEQLVTSGAVKLTLAENDSKLYIEVIARDAKENTVRAVVDGSHTNLVLVEYNGKPVFTAENSSETGTQELGDLVRELSIEEIFRFADSMDTNTEVPEMILRAIEINTAISDEGLRGDYGLGIGKSLYRELENGVVGDDFITHAMMRTSSGADARMAGAPIPVVTNSGSGNQGITCTVPVIAVAEYLKAPREKMVRAVTLSNLISVYIHSKFGLLSAHCGATAAGMSAGCGIVYLLGGGLREVEYVLHSMIGDVTGMLCDGGKPDCALKIATCVNAACHTALLAMQGKRVKSTDGIVEENVEKSIDNYATLGRQGSEALDRLILEMMLQKEQNNK